MSDCFFSLIQTKYKHSMITHPDECIAKIMHLTSEFGLKSGPAAFCAPAHLYFWMSTYDRITSEAY